MFIEIEAVIIVTHENPRNGDRIEDQRHQVIYRIDLAQLAGLIRPLAEMLLRPEPAGHERPNGRNGNGTYHVTARS